MTTQSRIRLVVAVALAATVAVAGQGATHRVERVIDGDTLVLAEVGTVRLIGVDTPETVDPRSPVEAFGREAAAFLANLVSGQSVRVVYDQTRTDRWGRTLAYLTLPDGRDVSHEIIRQGYGHAYTEFPFARMDAYRSAEREAREARRGLWSDARPASADNPLVYIMPTGNRYHQQSCRFVNDSARVLPISEVPGEYTPCLVCRPRPR